MRRFKIVENNEHYRDYDLAKGVSFRTGEVVVRWIGDDEPNIKIYNSITEVVTAVDILEKELDSDLSIVWIDDNYYED